MRMFSTQPQWQQVAGVFIACSLLVCLGCAADAGGEVVGQVQLDGAVLSGGKITLFHPSKPGRNVSANIQPDGRFRVLHAPRGQVKVTVVPLPPKRSNGTVAKQSTGSKGGVEVPPVPLKYTDPTTTDLVYDIGLGSQEILVDLSR